MSFFRFIRKAKTNNLLNEWFHCLYHEIDELLKKADLTFTQRTDLEEIKLIIENKFEHRHIEQKNKPITG